MKLSSFSNALKESFANIIRNRLMSAATVITLSAGLFLFGLTSALTLNVFSITEKLQSDFKLEVYISEEYDMNKKAELEAAIKGVPNVREIEFIPNEVAFQEMKTDFPAPELLEGFDNTNVLRDAYRITLTNLDSSADTVSRLEQLEGIAKVSQLAGKMQSFLNLITKLQIATVIVSVILGLLAILIITNTINMSIFSRKKQINIMKYVGATDGYIKLPFLLEGLFIGLISATFSYFAVYFLYDAALGSMGLYAANYGVLSKEQIALPLAIITGGMGIILGCMGSLFSIRKHLKV